jgi:endonuclease YncB( thermonuclease family)
MAHLLLALFLFAAPQHKDFVSVKAVVDFVYDGDTFFCHTKHKKNSVRLMGFDAPEIRPGERAERQALKASVPVDSILARGLRARDKMREALHPGDTVTLMIKCKDSFGRWLAKVKKMDGSEVGQ